MEKNVNNELNADLVAAVAKHLPGDPGDRLKSLAAQAKMTGKLENEVTSLRKFLIDAKVQRDEAQKKVKALGDKLDTKVLESIASQKGIAQAEASIQARETNLEKVLQDQTLAHEQEKVKMLKEFNDRLLTGYIVRAQNSGRNG